MVTSSTASSYGRRGYSRELCRVHQLLPYSEVVQFGDNHGNMRSPPFFSFFSFFLFFFFFFGGYGAWGSTPLQLLLSGGMACVVATCHAKIDWGVLGSSETFQFSYVFWGTSFLNPLCFLSVPTFWISQLLLCLFPLPQLLLCLLLWFPSSFCTHPFDFSISPSFLGTPFVFLFFLSF